MALRSLYSSSKKRLKTIEKTTKWATHIFFLCSERRQGWDVTHEIQQHPLWRTSKKHLEAISGWFSHETSQRPRGHVSLGGK